MHLRDSNYRIKSSVEKKSLRWKGNIVGINHIWLNKFSMNIQAFDIQARIFLNFWTYKLRDQANQADNRNSYDVKKR